MGLSFIKNAMKDSFEKILSTYSQLSKTVDSKTETYKCLCKTLPFEIRNILHNNNRYTVKGSMGQGNRTDYPWISILDKNITTTTQKGLYIVYLFQKNMNGFYLTLNQGITNFDSLYKKDKYKKALAVSNYFREQIDDTSFSKMPITLNSEYGDLGYGYECTTILQKYYPVSNYQDIDLKNDLEELIHIYDFIVKHMSSQSYDEVIKSVLIDDTDTMIDAEIAIDEIQKAVDPSEDNPYDFIRELSLTEPHKDRTNKFNRVTTPKFGKIDYVKKAHKDAKAGLLGEELAIKYEQDKLLKLGLENYCEKVKWVSKDSDAYGYDIESYDLMPNGKICKIFIEVKTTISRVDTEFFVSKNELNKSKEYKNNYCVYRIYDVNSKNPKFYKAFGEIDKNFILDPYTYMARYKYKN